MRKNAVSIDFNNTKTENRTEISCSILSLFRLAVVKIACGHIISILILLNGLVLNEDFSLI